MKLLNTIDHNQLVTESYVVNMIRSAARLAYDVLKRILKFIGLDFSKPSRDNTRNSRYQGKDLVVLERCSVEMIEAARKHDVDTMQTLSDELSSMGDTVQLDNPHRAVVSGNTISDNIEEATRILEKECGRDDSKLASLFVSTTRSLSQHAGNTVTRIIDAAGLRLNFEIIDQASRVFIKIVENLKYGREDSTYRNVVRDTETQAGVLRTMLDQDGIENPAIIREPQRAKTLIETLLGKYRQLIDRYNQVRGDMTREAQRHLDTCIEFLDRIAAIDSGV